MSRLKKKNTSNGNTRNSAPKIVYQKWRKSTFHKVG